VRGKLRSHRRRFAIAHLFLKRYGWPIIFLQRYIYGFRTIIPMSIGVTRYSAKMYALINLLSAWVWAAITITPAYFYGDDLLILLVYVKCYWYFSIPFVAVFICGCYRYFKRVELRFLQKRVLRRGDH